MKLNKIYLSLSLVVSSALAAQSIIPEQTVQMGGFNFKVEGYEGSYIPLTDERVNTGIIRSGNGDDGSYAAIPIGFSFSYLGKTYTEITPSTNGWFAFGDQAIEKELFGLTNDLENGGTRALVAPLWDDMVMTAAYGAEFRYFNEGSKDGNVFTAEWRKVVWTSSAEGPVMSFQVKLYEADNRIEFIYSDEANAYSSSKGGASIGITSEEQGAGSFISITPKLDEFSTKTASDDIMIKPKTNQVFSFIQADRTPVELVSFTSEQLESKQIILKWETKTETNNSGWEIEERIQESGDRSQNTDWKKIGFVAGKGTTTEKQNYSFSVSRLQSPVFERTFRLKQIDTDGKFEYSNVLNVNLQPEAVKLFQNYPNPFNPTTKISYLLTSESHVIITVYDLLGREIKTLVNSNQNSGIHSVNFDALNLQTGLYFYKLSAGKFSETKSMMVIK